MKSINVAIITLEEFNEIDSLLILNILGRVKENGLHAKIVCPTDSVQSMNGIEIRSQLPLESVASADAVIFSSRKNMGQALNDAGFIHRIQLNARRQIIAAQCSGSLLLHQLGILDGMPACTDEITKTALEAKGVRVLDRAFYCEGDVATAGGCLAAVYLSAWVILRLLGRDAVRKALYRVAPVGKKEPFVAKALTIIES